MLKLQNLDLKTREILLYGSNMCLERGAVYGLSARNGSGKTTLLRTISGLRREDKAMIFIEEQNKIFSLIEMKNAILYYETAEWFDVNLSGLDYLNFIKSTWKNENQMPITEVINFWSMGDYIKLPIKKYSLGMKQKLLLSMYAVSGANYWLLDEPTIGLDTNSLEQFKRYMLDAKKRGTCVLFSSHQNDSIYAVCDFIFEMENRTLSLVANDRKLGD
ncbi:ATP-binding cassette domain-containing protein [Metabacillus malikii]|uniref:ABC-2 type transport system ATP-binding protein n=1 Tax=Metabacillus malikii TaxID=1504265 RepID=A0ABT9ZGL1_9BACI|nr:ATP-binding cassette domain-containing protein [Metabacillus malikii]MDQ0231407.1 ABC-2 type transport system ATP-binding protein [Metabacillus malikii]